MDDAKEGSRGRIDSVGTYAVQTGQLNSWADFVETSAWSDVERPVWTLKKRAEYPEAGEGDESLAIAYDFVLMV